MTQFHRAILSVLCLILAVSLGAPNPAHSASTRKKERFEILVPSSPAGSRDIYARVMARRMGRYLPDNPSIIVKNMPGAGGDIMLNYLFHRAKRDGSVFATGTNAMFRAQRLGLKSAQYDLKQFNFIGALPESPYLLVIRADHPIKSYQDLLTTKTPAFYGMERPFGGGSTELVGNALKDAFGAQMSFVTGYAGSAVRVNAILRKEIDMTLDRLSTAEEHLKDKKLRILLVLTYGDRIPNDLRGNAPEWFKLDISPEVRELSDFVITPTDLDKTYLAPPGVPADKIKLLRDAFEKTLAEPEVQKFLQSRRAVSPSITGETLQNEVAPRLLKVSETTVKKVKAWFEKK